MPLKPFDFFITVPALGAVIASFFFVYSSPGDHGSVCLKSDTGEWVFPADACETVNVTGPLGVTVIEISGGSAHITASPCINQTCVTGGVVRSPGQWLACLPNRVMLYITPSSENGNNKNENNVDTATW